MRSISYCLPLVYSCACRWVFRQLFEKDLVYMGYKVRLIPMFHVMFVKFRPFDAVQANPWYNHPLTRFPR